MIRHHSLRTSESLQTTPSHCQLQPRIIMIMVLLNRSRASGAGWFNYGISTATQLPILLQLKITSTKPSRWIVVLQHQNANGLTYHQLAVSFNTRKVSRMPLVVGWIEVQFQALTVILAPSTGFFRAKDLKEIFMNLTVQVG
jgi:hypothetical protein